MSSSKAPAVSTRGFFGLLYVEVLIAIALGIAVGEFLPDLATNEWIKAIGDDFVKLIKMIIIPVIFCTVVGGVAQLNDMRSVGRIGIKAIVWFEVISTFALLIGLVVGNVIQPGAGFGAAGADAAKVATYTDQAKAMKSIDFVNNIFPDNFVNAFATGNVLQVLLIALVFGFALLMVGDKAPAVKSFIDQVGKVLFGMVGIIVKFAPLGAFGAMAFTVGKYGSGAVLKLLFLMGTFYLTSALFVFVVLGVVCWYMGFSIFRLVGYLKEEFLVVLGTSSSESALPGLMAKLEGLGCPKSVVGLVVPTGYSFNLDGTNIYMTLATLFIAQALGVQLSIGEQLFILVVAMLTSKGATAVTGAGFITLAATLAAVRPELVPGMAIVFGIDKFMSECRALTNLAGNAVATVVVSKWENTVTSDQIRKSLAG